MERILANEVKNHNGKPVTVNGWVHSVRDVGKLAFIVLRDRSGKVQVVVKDEKLIAKVKQLHNESSIIVTGTAKKDEKVKMGGAEIVAENLEMIADAPEKLPVDVTGKTETNFETRFNHRVLDLRTDKGQAIFKVQNSLLEGFREQLNKDGFIEIHTPKIIATGTEGGTNLFSAKYFERNVFLAQSPQFYKQMLVGAGFERVYEVAPVFRAEEHNTPFHLNEYISMDFEMGFIQNELDVIKQTERTVKNMLKHVVEKNQAELELFKVQLEVPKEIPVFHYWDLPKIFKSMGKEFDVAQDLGREDEALICQYAKEKFNSPFAFAANYPLALRPFYTQPHEEKKEFSRSFDLLYNGLEIVSGGQRVHDFNLLTQRIKSKDMDPQVFDFYTEIFKYGMPPHGGQAFGLERLTCRLLGIQNVREASFFPRDRTRVTP